MRSTEPVSSAAGASTSSTPTAAHCIISEQYGCIKVEISWDPQQTDPRSHTSFMQAWPLITHSLTVWLGCLEQLMQQRAQQRAGTPRPGRKISFQRGPYGIVFTNTDTRLVRMSELQEFCYLPFGNGGSVGMVHQLQNAFDRAAAYH